MERSQEGGAGIFLLQQKWNGASEFWGKCQPRERCSLSGGNRAKRWYYCISQDGGWHIPYTAGKGKGAPVPLGQFIKGVKTKVYPYHKGKKGQGYLQLADDNFWPAPLSRVGAISASGRERADEGSRNHGLRERAGVDEGHYRVWNVPYGSRVAGAGYKWSGKTWDFYCKDTAESSPVWQYGWLLYEVWLFADW